MMDIDGIPNVVAENTPAVDGMRVRAQNLVGSLRFDLLGFLDAISWAMPAGFYYRMFHKPEKLWPLVLKQIRKMAGLGSVDPRDRFPGRFDELYPSADVCVIGGGPAGMSAALAAAHQKLRVILLERRPWLGGCFEYRPAPYTPDRTLYEHARELTQAVDRTDGIRVFRHTAVVGTYPGNRVTAFQKGGAAENFEQRYVDIRTRSLVVATGCIERPLIFANNERPGVMQVGCAHRLARTWGILPGKRIVFSIGHDLGIEAALDLSDLGATVLCVADIREDGQDPMLIRKLQEQSIPFFKGWVAAKAFGRRQVQRVRLSTPNGSHCREWTCDLLVASAGLTPVTGHLTLAGATVAHDEFTGFFLPRDLPAHVHAAGSMLGLQDPLSIEASGRLAGIAAAKDCGGDVRSKWAEARAELSGCSGPVRGTKLATAPGKSAKAFVCFDEDGTTKNVDQAVALGFDVPELIKRFTAIGTGPSQGGIPGHNLPLLIGRNDPAEQETPLPTTVRPPLVATFLATYSGNKSDVYKQTPLHAIQRAAGGQMERMGVWKRARDFSANKSIVSETDAVHRRVGMLDASTLGKFRLFGPDAIHVLQRIYVGNMAQVQEERIKYAAMCNEDGCLLDDGVVVKRGENDYYFTTSTGRAGATVAWIRYHTRYDKWRFHLVDLTDAFGVINLAGPKARDVLSRLTDADISPEAFPYFGYREFSIQKTSPVRVMRLGFVGEMSYEIHIPASQTEAVWHLLWEAGREFGIRPFGLEAQNVLRLEKGHIIIGSETEQRTTLHDLGLGALWYRDKPAAKTVGAVALRQTEHQKGRLKLVGIRMADPNSRIPQDGSPIVDNRICGYVCTARYSNQLQEAIGMALVEDVYSQRGSRLTIFEDGCEGNLLEAIVADMPFYDPAGGRMKM
jgi:sarcosine oxidase subunit alpha